jgi:hypothetical protein
MKNLLKLVPLALLMAACSQQVENSTAKPTKDDMLEEVSTSACGSPNVGATYTVGGCGCGSCYETTYQCMARTSLVTGETTYSWVQTSSFQSAADYESPDQWFCP